MPLPWVEASGLGRVDVHRVSLEEMGGGEAVLVTPDLSIGRNALWEAIASYRYCLYK